MIDAADVLKSRWAVGFKDRGMGHGDYGVVVDRVELDGTQVLVVEIGPDIIGSFAIAGQIVEKHNNSLQEK